MENILDCFSLDGKNALVICPENPYGSEIVQGLLAGGAKVWLAGDLNSMSSFANPNKLAYVHGDPQSAKSLEAAVREQIGCIDIVVENGLHTNLTGWEQSFETINQQLQQSHLGMMLTVQSLGHILSEQGHGSMILVTDYGALVGYDPHNYGSKTAREQDFSFVKGFIKGGAVNYVRQASNYLAEHGCRCNAIAFSPLDGMKDKDFECQYIRHSQVKRMMKPSDLAGALIFLASDASEYITGITLPVDGGYTAK